MGSDCISSDHCLSFYSGTVGSGSMLFAIPSVAFGHVKHIVNKLGSSKLNVDLVGEYTAVH